MIKTLHINFVVGIDDDERFDMANSVFIERFVKKRWLLKNI